MHTSKLKLMIYILLYGLCLAHLKINFLFYFFSINTRYEKLNFPP